MYHFPSFLSCVFSPCWVCWRMNGRFWESSLLQSQHQRSAAATAPPSPRFTFEGQGIADPCSEEVRSTHAALQLHCHCFEGVFLRGCCTEDLQCCGKEWLVWISMQLDFGTHCQFRYFVQSVAGHIYWSAWKLPRINLIIKAGPVLDQCHQSCSLFLLFKMIVEW